MWRLACVGLDLLPDRRAQILAVQPREQVAAQLVLGRDEREVLAAVALAQARHDRLERTLDPKQDRVDLLVEIGGDRLRPPVELVGQRLADRRDRLPGYE